MVPDVGKDIDAGTGTGTGAAGAVAGASASASASPVQMQLPVQMNFGKGRPGKEDKSTGRLGGTVGFLSLLAACGSVPDELPDSRLQIC